jgi:hypothetical protein
MFAFEWYGVDGIPGRTAVGAGLVSSENAWHGLAVIRWLMLLTIVLALASAAIHVWHPSRVRVAEVRLGLLLLGALTAVLVLVRVLIALPSPDRVVDQKLGAVLGLICAWGIALGSYESVREQRARRISLARQRRAADTLAPSLTTE